MALKRVLLALFIGFHLTIAFSQNASNSFVEGRDFSRLQTPDPTQPDLILVSWYGSTAAYQLYGALATHWHSDITLWPAVFREAWRPAAKLNLMANALDLSKEQHLQIFRSVIASPMVLKQSADFELFFGVFELNEEKVSQTVRQSELPKTLKNLQNRLKSYSISTVPTIIFRGEFIIDAKQARTPARLLQLLDYLDQQASSNTQAVNNEPSTDQPIRDPN